ncbi:helix-turn-helix transcriptional regulator [Clostridium baratii]
MISKNIERIRKFNRISQRELGRRIKMSGQYIAKIEKNQRNPPIDTLKKISSALDVELIEILSRPKILPELFWDTILKNNITPKELMESSKLSLRDIEDVLVNYANTFTTVIFDENNIFSLGKILGFSKAFCEKRIVFDRETRCSLSLEESNDIFNSLGFKFFDWRRKHDFLTGRSYNPLYSKNFTVDEALYIVKKTFNDHNFNILLSEIIKLNTLGKQKLIDYSKDLLEMPKYQKQIWEEEGKEYLMPNVAHEIEGDFTEEDYKQDEDIMMDDEFWSK